MSYVLTLVSSAESRPLTSEHIDHALRIFNNHNIAQTCEPVWLSPDKAVEIGLSDPHDQTILQALRRHFAKDQVDFFLTPIENRRKKLLLADMDSTIVEGETLDDLAAYAGLKDKVSEITAAAMEGKLDFHAAIRERVKLLEDLPLSNLQDALEQTKLNPGARVFVQTMTKHDAKCVLVSGGFTFFTSAIAKQAGFHENHGNTLGINERAQTLDGQVVDPILDKFAKVNFLKQYMNELQIETEHCLTIGDGANDIPMLEMAGLGIGYHPKQAVLDAVPNTILYGDLTAALYAQGYSEEHFVK